MSTSHNDEIVERITRQMGELPTSLEVVCRLMLMLRNPTQENEHVVTALYSDRQLSGQLVRKLDSNEEAQVDEKGNVIERKRSEAEVLQVLDGAVLQMGYTAILRLVSALSVGKLLAAEHKGYGMQRRDLWVHSVVVALIAQRLCELLAETGRDSIDPSLAFIAGLMHDTGKAALSTELMLYLEKANKAAFEKDANWIQIETELCLIDHAALGARLMQQWKLPKEVSDAVAFHHQPSKDHKLASLVHLADYASRFVSNPGGWSSYAIKVDPAALAICHLRLDDIQRVVLHVSQDRGTIDTYANI
jgi:putative nucleotidyltransferase with HDIG domain